MKNRNLNHSDNWATPPYFYDKLNEEFDFDFDPCPYNTGELEFDGLTIDWGKRNFINPPYSQKLKEDFVKKAIYEAKKGKLCVLLLPVSTSTKLFHDFIKPNAKEIRFVERRIKFIGINSKGEYVNWDYWKHCAPIGVRQKNNSGMHDSMIVIF
jgi:site-specific DNA-methyltransferase (adenine-specific)